MNTYEKKLKEALVNENTDYEVTRWIEQTFPELKKSEDEKIRKSLLELVHDTAGDELWVDYNVHKEDALAWFEKQDLKFKVGDLIINKDGNGKVKQILEATNSGYTTNDGFAIREIYEKNYRRCEIKDICQWKPSDEQMNAIKIAIAYMTDECETPTAPKVLCELLEQLKKLTE